MTRRLAATAFACVALVTLAAPADADCVSDYRYAISHNPYRPLPSGGGGGEPGGGPMPGQPREWAGHNVTATTAFAKCLAGPA